MLEKKRRGRPKGWRCGKGPEEMLTKIIAVRVTPVEHAFYRKTKLKKGALRKAVVNVLMCPKYCGEES